MAQKETFKQAGYKYDCFNPETGEHYLHNLLTGDREVWFANKNHASYGLRFKNTHLEFARSVTRESWE